MKAIGMVDNDKDNQTVHFGVFETNSPALYQTVINGCLTILCNPCSTTFNEITQELILKKM